MSLPRVSYSHPAPWMPRVSENTAPAHRWEGPPWAPHSSPRASVVPAKPRRSPGTDQAQSPSPHPDAAGSNLKPDSEGRVECTEEDVSLAGLCPASRFRQGKAPRHHLFPPPEQKHRSPRCTLPLRRGGLASFATKPVRFPLGQGNTTGNESKKGRL